MTRIRVLVVDDSVVARRMLTDILSAASDIEVVGTAANGSIALQKIPQVSPELVLCDVEMPVMDGIETVTRIRRDWPRTPIIMCSTLTERGAASTLRAISAGASDYIAKPSSLGGPGAFGSFAVDLLAKVRALGGPRGVDTAIRMSLPPPSRPSLAPPSRPSMFPRAGREAVSVLGIGSSTGGPNALATLFAALPKALTVPIFVTQHMPPMFTKLLAERLAASSGYDVVEAADGDIVQPGRAYIAPGNFHMTVVRAGTLVRVSLNQDPQENSCRPAVDVMFRSLARIFGGGTLAAVLTGMGQDGARGAQHIVEVGGELLVQEASSCVVPSMPNATAAAVKVSGVYPIERIGTELVSRIARRAMRSSLFPSSLTSLP